MGILNVTPDSFSDGGRFVAPEQAVDAALEMEEAGACIIDVGGESTRPGSNPVSTEEQIRRVVPVVERICQQSRVIVSIDTTRGKVAAAAIEAGAQIINDVSAGQDDPEIFDVAARSRCGLILMHRRVQPKHDAYSNQYKYGNEPRYGDVVVAVRKFLSQRCDAAIALGVSATQLILDPGLGFGKSVEQNYQLVSCIGEFDADYPVLFAASRKSFIGAVLGETEPADRDVGSVALAISAYQSGARLFRVHNVAAHRQALSVCDKLAEIAPHRAKEQ